MYYEKGLSRIDIETGRTRDFLFGELIEVVCLALIWGATSMPEEEPLQALIALQLILEPKCVIFIRDFQKIEKFGRSLHDRERGRLVIVDNDWDSAFKRQSAIANHSNGLKDQTIRVQA